MQQARSIHDKINDYAYEWKESFFASIGNYLEKGYKFIRIKTDRTLEQQNYLRAYEKMFLLQSTGFIFLTISGLYFLKITLRKKTITDEALKRLLIRGGIVSAIGAVLTFNAFRINSNQKVLQKTEAYGKRFEALAKALTPQNLSQKIA